MFNIYSVRTQHYVTSILGEIELYQIEYMAGLHVFHIPRALICLFGQHFAPYSIIIRPMTVPQLESSGQFTGLSYLLQMVEGHGFRCTGTAKPVCSGDQTYVLTSPAEAAVALSFR